MEKTIAICAAAVVIVLFVAMARGCEVTHKDYYYKSTSESCYGKGCEKVVR